MDTCPRKLLLDNDELVALFEERRRPSGLALTTAAVQGLSILEDAVSWRMDDEIESAKATAAAQAKLAKEGGR